MEPSFKEYQKQIVANAKALANAIAKQGLRLVAGGTDNHVFLMEVHSRGITGREAEKALDRAGLPSTRTPFRSTRFPDEGWRNSPWDVLPSPRVE